MEQNFYKDLLENLYDGVYYVDNRKKITYWNKSAERITGYRSEEVMGHCCSENILRHIDDAGNQLCIFGCPLGATLQDRQVRESDVYLHHKLGHRVPVSVRVTPILNERDEVVGAVEIFSDRSKSEDLLKELQNLKNEVLMDELTQIGNRKYGTMNLEKALSELKNHNINSGLIFIDIDNFKKINDQYGHDIGDQVLKAVAKTILNLLRKFDVVCRWGGEEFIVLLFNCNEEILQIVAERIRVFLERSWIKLDKTNLNYTASLGAALLQPDDTIESFIKRADEKMYASKKAGKNRVTF